MQNSTRGKKYEWYHCVISNTNPVFVGYDPEKFGAKIKDVPLNKVFNTFEDFLTDSYDEYYDEDTGRYGFYEIDFDDPDYHHHSYLTLKELEDADKTKAMSCMAKIPVAFWKEFCKRGGKLPDGMEKIEDAEPNSIAQAFDFVWNPHVIIQWLPEESEKESSIMKGIAELKEIAEKYGVTSDNIRIVFAFDN